MTAMFHSFCNRRHTIAAAIAIGWFLVAPSVIAQTVIDESANCKPESAAATSAGPSASEKRLIEKQAAIEKFLLAERESAERRMLNLIPVLENSDEPLAWIWATSLQGYRTNLAALESKKDAALNPQNQSSDQERPSSIQASDLQYKRALDAAPRNPAVLVTLSQLCKFRNTAFCEAHPDLLKRWQAVDPDNGLLLNEKAFRQPVAVQVDLLSKLLAAPKIVSHAQEAFRVAAKLDAGMTEPQREELLRVLVPLASVPPVPLLGGPEVCNAAFRSASGVAQPGDADPGDAVKQQCLDLLRRVARESDNTMWEQYAAFRLQMLLPAGPEREQYKKQFEQLVVELTPVLDIDMSVAEGRLSRVEANKLLRQYMADVVNIGHAAARKRQIEASKALLAKLEPGLRD